MTQRIKRSTRRQFLKNSAGAAGAVMLSGVWAGCERRDPGDDESSAPDGRQEYTIFSEAKIAGLKVKNRIVRSATMVAAASEGLVTDGHIHVFKALAQGGVGLIITGFMVPTRAAANNPTQLNIYDDSQIEGLAKIKEAVQSSDATCRLFAQIGHGGATVSPSGIRWPMLLKRRGRVLETEEIEAIVTDFAEAVRRAEEAGFDGVELHGAHAYLLSSFLSPYTNQRTDKYGGSLENRVRIVKEIMEQTRDRVGRDYPVIIKVNSDDNVSGGIEPEDFPQLAAEIVNTGVDAIDVSGNDCTQRNINNVDAETYFLNGAVRAEVNVPLIVTGGNRTVENMESILNTGEVDFFGLARPLIREPDLPRRWLEGTGGDSARCISCNGCLNIMAGGQPAYCVQEV